VSALPCKEHSTARFYNVVTFCNRVLLNFGTLGCTAQAKLINEVPKFSQLEGHDMVIEISPNAELPDLKRFILAQNEEGWIALNKEGRLLLGEASSLVVMMTVVAQELVVQEMSHFGSQWYLEAHLGELKTLVITV
jgi:hypothetical protein